MTTEQKIKVLSIVVTAIFAILALFGIQIDVPVVSPEFPIK